MKKLFLTISVFSALTFSAVAQNEKTATPSSSQPQLTPEQKADKETAKATSALVLNESQKAKFKQFSLDRITANRALRAKATTKEEKQKTHELVKANNDKFFTSVNALLTPEQQTKWVDHKKKMEAKQADRNHQD